MQKFLWTLIIGCFTVYPGINADYYAFGSDKCSHDKLCRMTRADNPELYVDILSDHLTENYRKYKDVQKIYDSTGLKIAYYHLGENANLAIESSQVFPDEIPMDLMFECTFRISKDYDMTQTKWNLFELSYNNSQTTIGLALNPHTKSIVISIPKVGFQSITIEKIDIFDYFWHNIIFDISNDHIRVCVDCKLGVVESKYCIFPLHLLGIGRVTSGIFTIGRTDDTNSSVPLDLQRMVFKSATVKRDNGTSEDNPGENKPSQYAEPSFPNSNESTCSEQCPKGLPGPPGNTVRCNANDSCEIRGVKGELGAIGEKGERGFDGFPGPVGITGDPAPPRLTELTDVIRAFVIKVIEDHFKQMGNSVTGVKAEEGMISEFGRPGLPGSKGERGSDVFSGTPYDTGYRGLDGAAGLPGAEGVKGQKGFHFYEGNGQADLSDKEPDDNEVSNVVLPSKCEIYEEDCRKLGCPYRVQRVAVNDENNCSRCECVTPCENYECAEGQQCVIDISDNGNKKLEPVCRYINKPGECPILHDDKRTFICVQPAAPTASTLRPTTESKAALEPKQPHEIDVQSKLGGIAVLRCFATGTPSPNVTWSTNNLVIDTTQGRFLGTGGDLTIVPVRQTDSGSYVCVASNGLGEPVRRVVELQVTEPSNRTPAYFYGPKNVTYIGALSFPISLRCSAGGNPEPHVTWWRNKTLMPRFGDDFDQSLLFKSIKLSDLGAYTCQAYNGIGGAASLEVILKASGSARALSPEDEQFLQYVMQKESIETTQSPPYTYGTEEPQNIPPLSNAHSELTFDSNNSYILDSTVIIDCVIKGYPRPNVTWTKDGVPLQADERINFTENPYSVVIKHLRAEDAGSYACTARNSHSDSTSIETLNITAAIYVPPYCKDNLLYVNCKQVVLGQYCNNSPYFTRFCCKSCMLAGQIRLPLPALNGTYF